jgi:hypothetical protein
VAVKAFPLDDVEPLQRERHRVGARDQVDDAEGAAPIGHGGARLLNQRRARDLDDDAGKDRAGRIGDDPGHRGSNGLRIGRCG